MKRWISLALPLFVLYAPSALASPITFNFAGTITQDAIQDPNDPFGGADVSGASFSASYTFDSAAVDVLGSDSTSGSYQMLGLPFSMTVTIAGQTFSTNDFLAININHFPSAFDFYGVIGCTGGSSNCNATPSVAGVFNTLELSLANFSGNALSSDALLLTAPLLTSFIATFSLNQVAIDAVGNISVQLQLQGNLESLTSAASPGPIPEPATLLLVGSGLSALASTKRAAHRKRLVKSSVPSTPNGKKES